MAAPKWATACSHCGGPLVDMEKNPIMIRAPAPCFNCFIQRPFGRGVCKTCRAEKPLVRRYLSGLFCDVHAPPRTAN